jgi:hypothetical protein
VAESPAPPGTEAIADNEIDPIMRQIFAICTEHKIAMFFHLEVCGPEEGDFFDIKTLTVDETGNNHEDHAKLLFIMKHIELLGALTGALSQTTDSAASQARH